MPKVARQEKLHSLILGALRDERLRQNLSTHRLAEKTGLNQSTISLMERDLRSPSLETLIRIADALEIDLGALIQRVNAGLPRA